LLDQIDCAHDAVSKQAGFIPSAIRRFSPNNGAALRRRRRLVRTIRDIDLDRFAFRPPGCDTVIVALLFATIASSPTLGVEAGRCRAPENGPAFLVEVAGLKDRAGRLKLELYPADDGDFLADDNVLVAAGKPFARVEVATPAEGPVQLCIRAPAPGRYALSLLHDRNGDRKFELSSDGIGFSANPKLGWSKPAAKSVAIDVGDAPRRITIVMNYRHGLGMRPER
jgi:uncharacterized protein (DUF2141 family)